MAFQTFADRAARVLALLACSAFLAFPAMAKDYRGAVRILVGWPAGGATDILTRSLAERLTTALGQPIIIENKSGAGGLIAAQTLKGAPADGSVVMLALDHTLVILPLTNKTRDSMLCGTSPLSPAFPSTKTSSPFRRGRRYKISDPLADG